jgi:hypothetical protein
MKAQANSMAHKQLINKLSGINIPRTLVPADFNPAKIAKLANKTEEEAIILPPDALKIITIAFFMPKKT